MDELYWYVIWSSKMSRTPKYWFQDILSNQTKQIIPLFPIVFATLQRLYLWIFGTTWPNSMRSVVNGSFANDIYIINQQNENWIWPTSDLFLLDCNTNIYAGTVMTSFDHVMIPTRGTWFQTNPLDHELDDHAGNTVSFVCVCYQLMVKDKVLQRQIWSTFVTALWFRKTEIGSCESLVSYNFQNLLTILARFLQIYHKKAFQFLPHWYNVEKNGAFSLFETSIKGNVTFAYIMTFQSTSI